MGGFGREHVIPEGRIELPVVFGSELRSVAKMVEFLVINYASSYNAILGRHNIHRLMVIYSTYHQSMKFPTRSGVVEIRGNNDCHESATTPP